MEWLKNRRTAQVTLTAIVMLLVLSGSVRPVSGLRQQAEQILTQETCGNGLETSHYLGSRVSLSRNLTTIVERYLDANDVRIMASWQAADALAGAQTPSAKYRANLSLDSAFQSMYDAMKEQYPLQRDTEHRTRLLADLKSRNTSISCNDYNGLARNFNDKVLKPTPGGTMTSIIGMEPLELYIMTGGDKWKSASVCFWF